MKCWVIEVCPLVCCFVCLQSLLTVRPGRTLTQPENCTLKYRVEPWVEHSNYQYCPILLGDVM